MHVFLGFKSENFQFLMQVLKFSDFNSGVCVNSAYYFLKPTQGKRCILVFVYFLIKVSSFGLIWINRGPLDIRD